MCIRDSYYPVKVTATDEAGNSTSKDASDSTLGSSLRLTVKEKVAPVIAIVSPTAGSFSTNSKPTITWKAVSYTHLDVYKRQGLRSIRRYYPNSICESWY